MFSGMFASHSSALIASVGAQPRVELVEPGHRLGVDAHRLQLVLERVDVDRTSVTFASARCMRGSGSAAATSAHSRLERMYVWRMTVRPLPEAVFAISASCVLRTPAGLEVDDVERAVRARAGGDGDAERRLGARLGRVCGLESAAEQRDEDDQAEPRAEEPGHDAARGHAAPRERALRAVDLLARHRADDDRRDAREQPHARHAEQAEHERDDRAGVVRGPRARGMRLRLLLDGCDGGGCCWPYGCSAAGMRRLLRVHALSGMSGRRAVRMERRHLRTA